MHGSCNIVCFVMMYKFKCLHIYREREKRKNQKVTQNSCTFPIIPSMVTFIYSLVPSLKQTQLDMCLYIYHFLSSFQLTPNTTHHLLAPF